MAWRGKYVGWYRLLQNEYEEFLPVLSDREVMENVSTDDRLLIPDVNKTNDKTLPRLFLALSDNKVTFGVLYDSKKGVDHLLNLFKETHLEEKREYFNLLKNLGPSFETRLYKKPRDSKLEIVKSYITSRVDEELLRRIIEESDTLRRGGRQIINNTSIYVPPQNPIISLVEVKVLLDQNEFLRAASELKPIFRCLVELKTQREVIRERLQRPVLTQNEYMKFIDLLNESMSRGLIDAETWRTLSKHWRDVEDDRQKLLDEVKERIKSSET
jgi:hypothetical protein